MVSTGRPRWRVSFDAYPGEPRPWMVSYDGLILWRTARWADAMPIANQMARTLSSPLFPLIRMLGGWR